MPGMTRQAVWQSTFHFHSTSAASRFDVSPLGGARAGLGAGEGVDMMFAMSQGDDRVIASFNYSLSNEL